MLSPNWSGGRVDRIELELLRTRSELVREAASDVRAETRELLSRCTEERVCREHSRALQA